MYIGGVHTDTLARHAGPGREPRVVSVEWKDIGSGKWQMENRMFYLSTEQTTFASTGLTGAFRSSHVWVDFRHVSSTDDTSWIILFDL